MRSNIEELWAESLASFEHYHACLNQLLTLHRVDLPLWTRRVLLDRLNTPLAVVLVEM